MLSLRRSLLKEHELPPFVGTVPFLCACVAPLPVRVLRESLYILIILIQFQFQFLFIYLFIRYNTSLYFEEELLNMMYFILWLCSGCM